MTEIELAERHQIYNGIVQVAARCDGATTLDGQGFDGTDTHFGRRIAAVSFDAWTPEVHEEAARIAVKYQKQILAYTGVDVTTLQVVKQATEKSKYAARDMARTYERRAKGASKIALRKIDAVGDRLGIFYDRKDPDFDALLTVCKALPGRSFDWDLKCNVVPVSEAIEDFVLTWDFPLTDTAQKLLQAGPPEFWNVKLSDNGQKIVIDTPYNACLVDRIKQLPGRTYVGGSINHADIHPAVVDMVIDFGLKCHPDARHACEDAQTALEAREAAALVEGDLKTLVAHVSAAKDPASLPPAFIDLLEGVLSRYGAEGAIVR